MKANYLFPNQFKKIGMFLFIPGFIFGIIFLIFSYEPDFLNIRLFAFSDFPIIGAENYLFTLRETNALDEIIALLLIGGAILIAFSKEKNEDEFIAKIRLESLVWATYINYAILILAVLFFFGRSFLWALVFNMFTILFFFIIRFNWVNYKSKKSLKDEE